MQRTRVLSVLVLVSTLYVADAATAIVQGVHRQGKLACLATTSSATPPASQTCESILAAGFADQGPLKHQRTLKQGELHSSQMPPGCNTNSCCKAQQHNHPSLTRLRELHVHVQYGTQSQHQSIKIGLNWQHLLSD